MKRGNDSNKTCATIENAWMKYFLPAEEWDKLPDSLPSAEMSLKTKNEERKCKGFRNGSLRRKNIGDFFLLAAWMLYYTCAIHTRLCVKRFWTKIPSNQLFHKSNRYYRTCTAVWKSTINRDFQHFSVNTTFLLKKEVTIFI